jgi:hypothetical protein
MWLFGWAEAIDGMAPGWDLFFENFIIPLAKTSEECNWASFDEYLTCALQSRHV